MAFFWVLCDKEGETAQSQASERGGSPETMPSTASRTRDIKQNGSGDETGSQQKQLDELSEIIRTVREMNQVVTRLQSRVDELPRRQQNTNRNEPTENTKRDEPIENTKRDEPLEIMKSLLQEVAAIKGVIEQKILERIEGNGNVEGLREITEKVRKVRQDFS